jgi:hypothetical protein
MHGRRWDVADCLDGSDIFILTSYCEGMPLSIMEATAISGTPEALGETAKVLPSPAIAAATTIHEMVATLSLWASDRRLRAAVGAECKLRAKDRMITVQVLDHAASCIHRYN